MDKYGLIGYPLGHSFSISYFNQKFADEGINAKYENFEIASIDILPEILDKNPELKGLNVTIPYKEKVMPYLDNIAPEARAIGAVNVIRVTHDGKDINVRELKKFLQANLALYKIPREFHLMEKLPRTSTGKIAKRMILDEFKKSKKK